MADPEQKKVQLNVGLPAVATDGNGISIDDNGNVGLVFFQVVNQTNEEITANAVANIRMNLEQLKQLDQAIQNAVDQDQEKKQKKD